jgi:hypothetical protein
LLDGIVATSVDSSKYIVRQRNIHLEIIKKYIEFDFDLPTLEDKLDHLELNCNNDTDTYNNSTVKINDIESEVISGFYNACKYRKENEYLTKEQINESYELYVTMTSNYDYIEMIKTLDSFYLNLKIKRDKAMSKQVESNDN